MDIRDYIADLPALLQPEAYRTPWDMTERIREIIRAILPSLGPDYRVDNEVAIHRSVTLEEGVVLKGPVLFMEGCSIGAHAYFREGVFLAPSVSVGPSSEIKSSFIGSGTAIAHLNYIGNSIIGGGVNFEAGSVAANHFNERTDKRIRVRIGDRILDTGVTKFGALVGDRSRIGANAVLSPGTLLEKDTIVNRLELIDQWKDTPHT